MARREETGLTFEAPDDWVDRTMITYTAQQRPGEAMAPTLVVTRDDLRATDSVQTYADRHLLQLCELPGFALVDSGKRTIGEGYPAVFLRFHWRPQAARVDQCAILVEATGATGREVRLFTTSTLADNSAKDGPRFEAILKTVRLTTGKGPAGGAPPPAPPSPDPAPFDVPIPMPGYPRDRKR